MARRGCGGGSQRGVSLGRINADNVFIRMVSWRWEE